MSQSSQQVIKDEVAHQNPESSRQNKKKRVRRMADLEDSDDGEAGFQPDSQQSQQPKLPEESPAKSNTSSPGKPSRKLTKKADLSDQVDEHDDDDHDDEPEDQEPNDDDANSVENLEREIQEIQNKLQEKKRAEKAQEKKRDKKSEQKSKEQNPGTKPAKGGSKKNTVDAVEQEKEMQNQVNELVNKMLNAVKNDNEANMNKCPALNKLLMIEEVTQKLKKSQYHEYFIQKRGLAVLAMWLQPLPDDTYPNQKIIIEVLHTVNSLNVKQEDLDDQRILGRIIMKYQQGVTGNAQATQLAKTIYDKWTRMVHNISTRYDKDGSFNEDKYRQLKRKIDKIKSDAAVANGKNGSNMHDVIPGRIGIRLPPKNAFDFVDKPDDDYGHDDHNNNGASGQNDSNGVEKLKSVMLGLKKKNRVTYSNKRMQLVKIDY